MYSNIKNERDGACSMQGETRNVYKILIGKLKARKNLGDLGVNERMTLQWNFGKWVWRWEVYLTENKEQWVIITHNMKKLWTQVRCGGGAFLCS